MNGDDDALVLTVEGQMVAQWIGNEFVGIGFEGGDGQGDPFNCWLIIPAVTAVELAERLAGALTDVTRGALP